MTREGLDAGLPTVLHLLLMVLHCVDRLIRVLPETVSNSLELGVLKGLIDILNSRGLALAPLASDIMCSDIADI